MDTWQAYRDPLGTRVHRMQRMGLRQDLPSMLHVMQRNQLGRKLPVGIGAFVYGSMWHM